MDEDDLEYRPEDEVFLAKVAGGETVCFNRARWADNMRRGGNWGDPQLKPPPWWLEQQDLEGRTKAKFAIWNHRYSLDKKIGKWLVAPLDDYRRAGYLVKR